MAHHATHLLLSFLKRLEEDLKSRDAELSEVIGNDETALAGGPQGKSTWLMDHDDYCVHITIERL